MCPQRPQPSQGDRPSRRYKALAVLLIITGFAAFFVLLPGTPDTPPRPVTDEVLGYALALLWISGICVGAALLLGGIIYAWQALARYRGRGGSAPSSPAGQAGGQPAGATRPPVYQRVLPFAIMLGFCLVSVLLNSDLGPLSNRLVVAGQVLWLFAVAGIFFTACFGLPWLIRQALSRYRRRQARGPHQSGG